MVLQPEVAIILGSASDAAVMEPCSAVLNEFGIGYEIRVMSAHRTPDKVRAYASACQDRGVRVIICGAGMAAHLAGFVSAYSDLPVIGVPLAGGVSDGLDALLSTVQMPGGTPVATVAVGTAGAKNAAVLAARILALADERLAGALAAYRKKISDDVDAADANLPRAK